MSPKRGMKNKIKITRVAGKDTTCTATLTLEFDFADPEAVERFARVLRELIPEEDRAQFLSDFQEAAAEAGLKVSAG
jgi:hypothetical protein